MWFLCCRKRPGRQVTTKPQPAPQLANRRYVSSDSHVIEFGDTTAILLYDRMRVVLPFVQYRDYLVLDANVHVSFEVTKNGACLDLKVMDADWQAFTGRYTLTPL